MKTKKNPSTPERKAYKPTWAKRELTSLGALIAAVRQDDLRLKQNELARTLGVDPAAVSHWEKGSFAPSTDVLLKIADLASPNRAIDLYLMAGVNLDKLRLLAGSPVIAGSTELDLFDADNALSDRPTAKELLPKGWLENRHSLCAVRIKAPIQLFPFKTGDVAVVERAIPRLSGLVDRPAAVHFSRYPERFGSSGPAGSFDFAALHVGWLALARPEQSESWSGKQPWQLVLRGASVRDVAIATYDIPISEWRLNSKAEIDDFRAGGDLSLRLLPNITILGAVVCWRRVIDSTDLVLNAMVRTNRKG